METLVVILAIVGLVFIFVKMFIWDKKVSAASEAAKKAGK